MPAKPQLHATVNLIVECYMPCYAAKVAENTNERHDAFDTVYLTQYICGTPLKVTPHSDKIRPYTVHDQPDQICDHVCPVSKNANQSLLTLPLCVLATCIAHVQSMMAHATVAELVASQG